MNRCKTGGPKVIPAFSSKERTYAEAVGVFVKYRSPYCGSIAKAQIYASKPSSEEDCVVEAAQFVREIHERYMGYQSSVTFRIEGASIPLELHPDSAINAWNLWLQSSSKAGPEESDSMYVLN